jgi:hypothetical protein
MMNKSSDNVTALAEMSNCDHSVLSGIFSLPPAQFTLLATVIGFLFMDGLDLGQQNSLGNFLVTVGQTILTSASQGQLLQDSQDPSVVMQKQLQQLRKQVDTLERKVNRR